MKKTYFLLLLLLTSLAQAQSTQTQQKPNCATPEFRQFDFWVGEWTVDEGGKPAGTSSIQLILDKCVVMENWTGRSGYSGKSFNLYNASLKKWQQYWVDNTGVSILFTGEFKEGVMRMQSEDSRMTFFPVSADRMRQLWEKTEDGGKTWQPLFDGNYVRKK